MSVALRGLNRHGSYAWYRPDRCGYDGDQSRQKATPQPLADSAPPPVASHSAPQHPSSTARVSSSVASNGDTKAASEGHICKEAAATVVKL